MKKYLCHIYKLFVAEVVVMVCLKFILITVTLQSEMCVMASLFYFLSSASSVSIFALGFLFIYMRFLSFDIFSAIKSTWSDLCSLIFYFQHFCILFNLLVYTCTDLCKCTSLV